MIEFSGDQYPGREFETRDMYLRGRVRDGQPRAGLTIVDTIPRSRVGLPQDELDWLTLVIGSGCPSITDNLVRRHLQALLHRLHGEDDEDSQVVVPGFDGPQRAFAAEFLKALIWSRSTDRLGDIGDVPGETLEVGEEQVATEVELGDIHQLVGALVVTRLLTTMFHAVRHLQGLPFDADSPAVFASDSADGEIRQVYLDPLLAEIEQFRDDLSQWVPDLFERLQGNPLKLTSHDLLRVTDWCWTKCLPGNVMPLTWGGVVTLLAPSRAETDNEIHFELPQYFMDRLNESVETMIEFYGQETPGGDAGFVLSAAEVLVQQAARRTVSQKLYRPPAAVAFTTTISMELEIALMSRRSDIVIVVPVMVREASTQLVRLCWIAGVVEAVAGEQNEAPAGEERYKSLKKPRRFYVISNLRSLDEIRTDKDGHPLVRGRRLADLPVVVHLSGCPFVDLPGLGPEGLLMADINRAMALPKSTTIEISHAIIGDEFLALQQSATESFFYPSTTGEAKHAHTVGLPRSFTSTDSPVFARYWMLCGVQLSDISTRLRLTPRLPRRPTDALPAKPLPIDPHDDRGTHGSVGGLAINRSLGMPERRLLRWSGLDLIAADVADFSQDLGNYARYLRNLP